MKGRFSGYLLRRDDVSGEVEEKFHRKQDRKYYHDLTHVSLNPNSPRQLITRNRVPLVPRHGMYSESRRARYGYIASQIRWYTGGPVK